MLAFMYKMFGYSAETVKQKASPEVKQVEQPAEEKLPEFILLRDNLERCKTLVLQLKKEKAEQAKVKVAVEAYIAAKKAYEAAKIAKGLTFVPSSSSSQTSQSPLVANSLHSPRSVVIVVPETTPANAPTLSPRLGK
jgi:hypothetical protein